MNAFKTLLSTLLLLCSVTSTFAIGMQNENGWNVAIGAGCDYAPVYIGSDKYAPSPYPVIDINYTHDNWEGFISILNGAGITYRNRNAWFFTTAGINFGEERDKDHEDTRDFLEGTPDLKNPVSYFSRTGFDFMLVELASRIEYYPVTAEYSSHPDRFYNAFLIGPEMIAVLPIHDTFVLLGSMYLSIMNDEYAQAYHGIVYDTESLARYTPETGLHRFSFECMAHYTIADKVTLICTYSGNKLLGDTEKSPLTKSDYYSTGTLIAMYTF